MTFGAEVVSCVQVIEAYERPDGRLKNFVSAVVQQLNDRSPSQQ